jgi:hypothetical protein
MISITLKLLQGVLRGSKKEKWAEHLTPEKLGEHGAKWVRGWFERKAAPDGTIESVTDEEIRELAAESPAAIQSLLVASLDAPLSSADETQEVLDSYAAVLNPIGDVMRARATSLALRGFLHDASCVSYWQLRDKHAHGASFRRSGDSLSITGGIEIYVLKLEPTDETLNKLNTLIREAKSRQLPEMFSDYRNDETIARVESVQEVGVTLRQLDPDREAKKATASAAPFGSLRNFDAPTEMTWQIPPGVPGLLSLIESLPMATDAQGKFLIELKDALEKLKAKN